MAERASLENWRPRKGSASSNLAPSANNSSRLTTSGSLRLDFLIHTPEQSEVGPPPRETDLRQHLHFCIDPPPYPSGCYARFDCASNSWHGMLSLN